MSAGQSSNDLQYASEDELDFIDMYYEHEPENEDDDEFTPVAAPSSQNVPGPEMWQAKEDPKAFFVYLPGALSKSEVETTNEATARAVKRATKFYKPSRKRPNLYLPELMGTPGVVSVRQLLLSAPEHMGVDLSKFKFKELVRISTSKMTSNRADGVTRILAPWHYDGARSWPGEHRVLLATGNRDVIVEFRSKTTKPHAPIILRPGDALFGFCGAFQKDEHRVVMPPKKDNGAFSVRFVMTLQCDGVKELDVEATFKKFEILMKGPSDGRVSQLATELQDCLMIREPCDFEGMCKTLRESFDGADYRPHNSMASILLKYPEMLRLPEGKWGPTEKKAAEEAVKKAKKAEKAKVKEMEKAAAKKKEAKAKEEEEKAEKEKLEEAKAKEEKKEEESGSESNSDSESESEEESNEEAPAAAIAKK